MNNLAGAKAELEESLETQLEQLGRTIAALTAAVEAEPMVEGSKGQVVANPALRELAALHKLKADLAARLHASRSSFGRK